ncbi:MAG: protein-glutamate O-methyltransferase family protein [Anaerolineae bacterium]|nr:protein-glutamate O-methyltransferase family protein [Anaerolineae bacterium]
MIKAPKIRTDTSNAFAHHTVQVRIPGIIHDTQANNPDFTPAMNAALDELAEEMTNDALIRPIVLPAPDWEHWHAVNQAHAGDTWLHTDWFYAEVYFYRLLIQIVRWWETGRDPFLPKKKEEYAGTRVWELLAQSQALEGSHEDKLYDLLSLVVWGNRIDLSFAASMEHGHTADADDLLVDDREKVVKQLVSGSGTVHLIADNAGTELAMDCALIAALLDAGVEVMLHLKLHPTFVSDATVPDLWTFIDLLEARRETAIQSLGQRLRAHVETGRLRFAPDAYWNSAIALPDMPQRIAQVFEGARLVIIKGDANYRRMVSDRLWPADTPLADVVDYFPAPLLAMRALKSDPIVGLPAGMAQKLDQIDSQWRVNGKRGVLQARL